MYVFEIIYCLLVTQLKYYGSLCIDISNTCLSKAEEVLHFYLAVVIAYCSHYYMFVKVSYYIKQNAI